VDAADYVAWRKSDGSQQGYNAWRTNFGRTAADATALFAAESQVPEPASVLLIGVGWWFISIARLRQTAMQ
jgi:hypothetical protein